MSTQQQESRPDRHLPAQESSSLTSEIFSNRTKRAGSLILGGLLVVRGLQRQSVGGIVLAMVGAGIIARTLRKRQRSDQISQDSEAELGQEPTEMAVTRSTTIGKSPEELYDAVRDPDVFSQIMGHFAEVQSTDPDRYHWTLRGPATTFISWETEIVEAEEGEFIRWETPEDASLPNSGSIRFRPARGDRGTVATLSLDFNPPGGKIGRTVLQRLDIVPETVAGHALGRFKSLVESGEIPSLEGNPSGRGQGDLL